MEGAGVRLRRAFGFGETAEFDPFLLLDDFRGNKPADYIRGFPWHPHRGIETITYVLGGTANNWGRTWSAADFSNTNFRVRVIDVASNTSRDFSLDYVAVNVTYAP